MVFLVFSEVLEMSSEVVGPGPTHGRSNLSGLTWDLLLVPSRPMPDACYPLVCLLCVWGGFPPGAPSWRCPQSSLFLFYKIQLPTGCRWYRCDSARRRGGTRRKAESVCSPPLTAPLRASLRPVLRCCYRRWGARAVPLAARLRALRVVPLVPLRALILRPSACAFMRRACVGRRQTV